MEDDDNHSGDNNEHININKHINNMAKVNGFKNKLIMIAQWGFIIGMLYFIYHVLRIIIILIRWLI